MFLIKRYKPLLSGDQICKQGTRSKWSQFTSYFEITYDDSEFVERWMRVAKHTSQATILITNKRWTNLLSWFFVTCVLWRKFDGLEIYASLIRWENYWILRIQSWFVTSCTSKLSRKKIYSEHRLDIEHFRKGESRRDAWWYATGFCAPSRRGLDQQEG